MTLQLPLAITFESPIALLGLALIPLAILLQRTFRRRAQRYAVRYTAVPTLRAVIGTTPIWRRHLPALPALLPLASSVLAIAKPPRTVAVPAEQASVVLVTDHSRSMMATDVSPTRLEAARSAALRFLSKVPGPVRVGAVAYSDAPDAVQAPTTRRDDVRRIINGLVADGSTATGDALAAALEGIARDRKSGRRPPAPSRRQGRRRPAPRPGPPARPAARRSRSPRSPSARPARRSRPRPRTPRRCRSRRTR